MEKIRIIIFFLKKNVNIVIIRLTEVMLFRNSTQHLGKDLANCRYSVDTLGRKVVGARKRAGEGGQALSTGRF